MTVRPQGDPFAAVSTPLGRAGLLAAAVMLVSCVSFKQVAVFGTPLDEGEIGRLEVGVTTLDEVFDRLGPPDFIIDGSQKLVGARSLLAGYAAQPAGSPDRLADFEVRIISADEGTVILVYTFISRRSGGMVAGWGLYGGSFKGEMSEDEVFVVISKQDLRVQEVVRRKGGV